MRCTVSVIIPVYNAEKSIRRVVESLVLGAWQDVQVILAEDCSTDSSWLTCQELSAEYKQVEIIRNETNRGVSFTRNRALDIAQGEYVFFVDSDDWVSHDYIKHLLLMEQGTSADSMVICGYHFIDKTNDARKVVVFDDERISEVAVENAYAIMEKILLQQLWNKIFRRDMIEKYHIRFDETQSMGEDFQFVLDYMEAAQIKKCVVLNEPLYYYIRWNNASLMSKFGFIQNQQEFSRIEQLHRISGVSSTRYRDEMIVRSKHNYIYHIVRSPNHGKKEKLEAIERIMGDGQAERYYREQQIMYAKEKTAQLLHTAKSLYPRVKGRIGRERLQKKITQFRTSLDATGITIISQNCIGGVIYHDLGMQFLSPTVNTFIPEPDFVKLVLDLRGYMNQELVMRWGGEYPVGMLGDVEIRFMHYETCAQAKESWDRRKLRINYDKVLVLATDRDGFDDEVYEQWKQIPYPKVLFTAKEKFMEDAAYFPEFAPDGAVGDLISDRRFYREKVLQSRINKAQRLEE